MTPTSLPRASAHSRAQPETPSLILCGERRPRYRSSSITASATESCTPNRHQAVPDQRQLVDAGTEHVDPLAAGDLGVQAEVLGHLADRDEPLGRHLAAG